MTTRSKVGLHGIGSGVGDYLRAITAAGIPGCFKSVRNEGWAVEAAEAARASGVPHTIIYRDPKPPGLNDDIPDFNRSPRSSAAAYWQAFESGLPAGVIANRDIIWIEPTNEMSTREGDAPGPAWVGEFCYELAKLMNLDGYRALLWGANAGQPEPEDWYSHFRRFLEYCSAHRDVAAISVHEGIIFGSTPTDPANYPWIAGRFKTICNAADTLGIDRPSIVLSEWARGPRIAPTKSDVIWLAELIAKYECVLGACLWNLDDGWGEATNGLAALLPWLQQYTLTAALPDPVPPPVKPPVPAPSPKWGTFTRQFNVRNEPIVSGPSKLYTAAKGQRVQVAGVVKGPSFEGSADWYEVRAFVHSAGLKLDAPEPPPLPATIDLLPYLRGDGRAYELQYTWAGGGTHPVQNQNGPDNTFWTVKGGGEYEELYFDDRYIYRGIDTSEAPDRFYVPRTAGKDGIAWIPRHWQVGGVFTSHPEVTHYLKGNCAIRAQGTLTNRITFKARYPEFTFDNGFKVADVVHLTWASGEEYWYGQGQGLVGFRFSGGRSYISEIHGPERRLTRQIVNCYQARPRYWAQ